MEIHEILSRHARQRSQQRGIPWRLIANVLDHHDRDSSVGNDCRVLRVSRNAARDFATTGGDPQTAERLQSIAVVWSDRTGRVVTVIHDGSKPAARRYRVGA